MSEDWTPLWHELIGFNVDTLVLFPNSNPVLAYKIKFSSLAKTNLFLCGILLMGKKANHLRKNLSRLDKSSIVLTWEFNAMLQAFGLWLSWMPVLVEKSDEAFFNPSLLFPNFLYACIIHLQQKHYFNTFLTTFSNSKACLSENWGS